VEGWFSVELNEATAVSAVQIASMSAWTDNGCVSAGLGIGCWKRTLNITIYIGANAGAPDTANDGVCVADLALKTEGTQDQTRAVRGLVRYGCTGGTHTGKYVKIWRADTLNICEVKVIYLIINPLIITIHYILLDMAVDGP
jgi:hypothetical protein